MRTVRATSLALLGASLALLGASLVLGASTLRAQTPTGWPSGRARLRFEVNIPASVRNEPTTGRVFVMLARANEIEPRFQIGRIGTPFFGRDVERLAPGGTAIVSGTDLGHPV